MVCCSFHVLHRSPTYTLYPQKPNPASIMGSYLMEAFTEKVIMLGAFAKTMIFTTYHVRIIPGICRVCMRCILGRQRVQSLQELGFALGSPCDKD